MTIQLRAKDYDRPRYPGGAMAWEGFSVPGVHGMKGYQPAEPVSAGRNPDPVPQDIFAEDSGGFIHIPPELSAQLFVGLCSLGKPGWLPAEIRDGVQELRHAQLVEMFQQPDIEFGATVLPGLGFWLTTGDIPGSGQEPSVSVIVMASKPESQDIFTEHMKALAMALALKFKQYLVPVRIQRGGLVIDGWNARAHPVIK